MLVRSPSVAKFRLKGWSEARVARHTLSEKSCMAKSVGLYLTCAGKVGRVLGESGVPSLKSDCRCLCKASKAISKKRRYQVL